MAGKLYIVATPIGNLEDITLRAIDVLQTVEVIACEDTRKTGFLLSRILPININTINTVNNSMKARLISYYEQNESQKMPEIINALKNGLNVALVSDAGTPTISDPGFKLVRECIKEGIKVESIPGPSAAISALVSSGLPTDKFFFVGYLPKKEGKRKKLLTDLSSIVQTIKLTLIIFESPYRLIKTLNNLMEIFGDINIVIARELTKVHEEIYREKISESLKHFSKTTPKGEFVILLNTNI
ncbi:MAG: 16S rRNA (cytidine(1402)-2'-O)-methyltransferase [Candidatus Levybacteria bacterium]|nr:16S rRNA (cytidine(1402)-2'-O)-methyltransferase [Candidatus Levybacteria bacterium]